MPKNKAPKVAYAVFVGRNPGVYSTWSEAEKQVKGFSRPEHKGYTIGEGGRAQAVRDFQGYGDKTTSEQGDNIGAVRKDIDQSKVPPAGSSQDSIRVQVSGYTVQPPTPCPCVAQQLQTPPNTLAVKKKERPISWDVQIESRKKASFVVDNDGTLQEATVFKSDYTTTDHRKLSATAPFYGPDGSSTQDSSSACTSSLSRNRSGFVANDTSSDESCSSDRRLPSICPDGNSYFCDPAVGTDSSGQVVIATDGEDHSGASTISFDNGGTEEHITGKIKYPQFSLPGNPRCDGFKKVTHHDRNSTALLPDAAFDPFSLVLDYFPICSSSDYGDFPDDPVVLDSIFATDPRSGPRLSVEQLALVELIMSGKNVFYTGSAGCGKSTVLNHFVPLLRREGKKVDILAPTGRAALAVNGRTLHNYAGWVPRSLGQPLRKLENDARGKKVWKRLRATEVLVLDEISMVANHVFERLNCVMKSARDSKKPFGGVQVIVTGDFCQLPPVKGFEYCLVCGTTLGSVSWDGKHECPNCSAQYEDIDKWAFRSSAWKECGFEHIKLDFIHRQKDTEFKAILEKSRLGLPWTVDDKWLLLEHESETKGAVRLYPRRVDVTAVNDMKLALLPGRALTYLCVDNFWPNPKDKNIEVTLEHCPEPMSHTYEALKEHILEPRLVLKEGMLVILLVNWDLDSSLANGSQGTIVGFEKHDPKLFPKVPRDWDHSSRKNGLVGVFVKRTAVQEWPIVQFLNGRKRTIYPRCMINELGDDEPYSLLSRTQIPLVAAWAMTVHKAQGMTLERVIVDLRHSFEPGQEYVALSRAETLGGLKVEGLRRRAIPPNEEVVEFMTANNVMPSMESDKWKDSKSEDVKDTG